jgi:hypothetical protein
MCESFQDCNNGETGSCCIPPIIRRACGCCACDNAKESYDVYGAKHIICIKNYNCDDSKSYEEYINGN